MSRPIFIALLLLISGGCVENSPYGFDLPEECGNRCEKASDINSFFDAIANSSARFSNCICIESGELEGDLIVGKPLNIIGRKDGSSKLKGVETGIFISADRTMLKDITINSGTKGITIFEAENVIVQNVNISGISVESSVVTVSDSKVYFDNFSASNIRAGSIFGGRGVVITGKRSEVVFENSKTDKTDSTGLLIDGEHQVLIKNSVFSNSGFAGIWVQNLSNNTGTLEITGSELSDNGAVSLQVLGNTRLKIDNSVLTGVSGREVNMEFVGDGIVVKNDLLSQQDALHISNLEVLNYYRAGIILDGINGDLIEGVVLEQLKTISDTGMFGVVVQNGKEPEFLREGVVENPFTANDIGLTEPLFIIETVLEL